VAFTQDFFTSRDNASVSSEKIGQTGRLWYDSDTNTIRISDGITPGGLVVGQGNGSAYILPKASTTDVGGIKVDGVLFTTDIYGNLSYNLPIASSNKLGGVKVDGVTVVVNPVTGVLSATGAAGPSYTLPVAGVGETGLLGGVKIGDGLNINPATGVLDAAVPYASTTQAGIVKVDGYSIIIDEVTGIMSATGNFSGLPGVPPTSGGGTGDGSYVLPIAGTYPSTRLGGVIVGSGLTINPFTGVLNLNLPIASTTVLGGVKVDGDSIVVNEFTGVISATASSINVGTLDANNIYTNISTNVKKLGFDLESGFDVIDMGNGIAKIAMNSTFKYWQINGVPALTAVGLDTVNFVPGTGITITADNTTTPKRFVISSTGTGSSQEYNLPIARSNLLGGIKVGSGLKIDADTGVLSSDIPLATGSIAGSVKVGTGLSVSSDGTLSVELPVASSTTLGAVKVDGTTIKIVNGVISASASSSSQYNLPVAGYAPNGQLGGVKVGTGLTVDSSGVLAAIQYSLPIASSGSLGGVKVGNTLLVSDQGVLNTLPIYGASGISVLTSANSVLISGEPATTTTLGVVKVDGTTIKVNSDGVITASSSGTVKTVSVVSSNGFTGSVASSTTSPAITLGVSVNGLLKGESGKIVEAISGTDYQSPITMNASGTTGPATFVSNLLNIPQYQGQLTLTTEGSSGSATLVDDVLNIPQYGTVKSVGLTSPDLDVTGATSPITSSGTYRLSLKTVSISKGGTGKTTAVDAFNALSPAKVLGDLIYFDGTNNVALPAGTSGTVLTSSSNGTPFWKSFSENAAVYVNINGSDSSGDGSLFNPYKTVSRAMLSNMVTNATNSNPVVIKVSAGEYTDSEIKLKPNVYIIGSGKYNTIISCPSVSLSPGFESLELLKSGFKDIAFNIASEGSFALDFLTLRSLKGQIYIDSVSVVGSFETKPYHGDNVLNIQNSSFVNATINGGWNVYIDNCQFISDLTINKNPLGFSSNSSYITLSNSYLAGNLNLNLTGTDDFNRLFVYLFGLKYNIASELNITGNKGTIYASTESIPTVDKVDNFNNAEIIRLNDSFGIGYNPGTPSNWSTVPNNVHTALENIATTISTLGTVKSVSFDTGTTGLTVTGGPITKIGTFTLGGVLSISNGGTGKSSFASGYMKSDGTQFDTYSTIPGTDIAGDISGNAQNVNGIVPIAHGGTGSSEITEGFVISDGASLSSVVSISTDKISGILPINKGGTGQSSFNAGYIKSNGIDFVSSATLPVTDIDGIIPVSKGGTNATNSDDALTNLLPSQTNKSGKFLTTNGSVTRWDDVPPPLPSVVNNTGKFLYTDGVNVTWQRPIPALPTPSSKTRFLTTNGTTMTWDELNASFITGLVGGSDGQIQFNNKGALSGAARIQYNTRDVLTVGSGTSDSFIISGKQAINDLYGGSSVYIKAGNSFTAASDIPVPAAGNVIIAAGGSTGLGIPGYITFSVGPTTDQVFRINNTGSWSFGASSNNVGQDGYVLMSSGEVGYPAKSTPKWSPLPEASTSIRGIVKLLENKTVNSIQYKSGLELIQNPSSVQADLVLKTILTDVDNSTITKTTNGVIKVDINNVREEIFPPLVSNKFLTTDGTNLIWGNSAYTLPIASSSTLGGVKVDGDTIAIDEDGLITVNLLNIIDNSTISLDWAGNLKVDITKIFPSLAGNSNKVLSTDGSILKWISVPLSIAGVGVAGNVGVVKVDGTTIKIDGTGLISVDTEVVYDAIIPSENANVGNILVSDTTGLKWVTPEETGLVSSVDVSGGTTGLEFIGGPINTTGVITMTGTLDITNGGTGASTSQAAVNNLLRPQDAQANTILMNTGTDVVWGTVAMGGPLPIASTTVLGAVKIDGDTILIDGSGVISSPRYVLPMSAVDVLGGVMIDGDSIVIDENGVISTQKYTLPTASYNTLGGVKVDNFTIKIDGSSRLFADPTNVLPAQDVTKQGYSLVSDGVSASWQPNNYQLPIATTTVLGGIKVDGTTITIDASGLIQATQYVLPVATNSVLGGVKVDDTTIKVTPEGIISGDILSMLPPLSGSPGKVLATDGSTLFWNAGDYVLEIATDSTLGGVKVDGNSIHIDPLTGVITTDINYLLPAQTDNSGKFLSTNGASASWVEYVLPIASTTTLGAVKVDGTTISINNSVITANGIKLAGQNNRLLYVGSDGLSTTSSAMSFDGTNTLTLGSSSGFTITSIANQNLTLKSAGTGAIQFRTGSDSSVKLSINSNGSWDVNSSAGVVGQALVTNGSIDAVEWGVVGLVGGGTGGTTAQEARTNILPSQQYMEGSVLVTNGSDVSWVPAMGDPMPVATVNRIGGVKPDGQTIVITGDGTISVTGFGLGTVTSVNVSGGTTGLTTTGGPITESGIITLSGTLNIANGGTGATTQQAALNNISGFTAGTINQVLKNNGTNVVFSKVDLTTDVENVLDLINGGTGGATPQQARTNILPSDQASNPGKFLRTDGTDVYWSIVDTTNAAGEIGQLQFNSDGVISGTSNMSYDGSNILRLGFANDGADENRIFNILGVNGTDSLYPSSIMIRTGASVMSNTDSSDLYLQGSLSYGVNTRGGNVYLDGGQASRSDGGSVIIRTTSGPNSSLEERLAIVDNGAWYLNGSEPGEEGQVITSSGPNDPPTWRFLTADGRGLTGDTLAPNITISSLRTLGTLDNLYVSGVTGLGTLTPKSKLAVSLGDSDTGIEIQPDTSTNTIKSINRMDDTYSSMTIEGEKIVFRTSEGASVLNRFEISKLGEWKLAGNPGETEQVLTSKGNGTQPVWQSLSIDTLLPTQVGNSGKVLSTDGTISKWITAATGTVTQVDINGGTTGLAFTGGPIVSSGTFVLGGTLSIEHGGTGQSSFTAGYIKSDGISLSAVTSISGAEILGDISGKASNVTGVVDIANGGTGASTVAGVIANLLPPQTNNTGKVLSTDGDDLIWIDGAAGSVTSVNVSGGSTGLTFAGGPIMTTGTLTMSGVLGVANGGTGANTQQEAINKLAGTTLTANTVLRSDGTNVTLSQVNLTTDVTGTLPINKGGTGKTSFTAGYIRSSGTALSSVTTIAGSDVSGDIAGNAENVNGVVSIEHGGTGKASFFAGYIKSNGTALFSSTYITGSEVNGDIPGKASNVTGVVAISNGGTGVTGFTSGYIKSDGTTLTSITKIDGSDIEGNIAGTASNVTGIVAIANGGTGKTSFTAGYMKSTGSQFNTITTIPGSDVVGDIAGNAINVTGVVAITNGGTGSTSITSGYVVSDGSKLSSVSTIPGSVVNGDILGKASSITGVLPLANGGTGIVATTTSELFNALTPDQAGKANKFLKTNGSTTSWEDISGLGTVTSINVSGGSTGLAFTGGPITTSGTITLSGTLSISNGGTGATAISSGYVKSNGTTLTSVTSISGADISGDITGKASNVTGIIAIANGGTGQSSFNSGYIKSDGSALSSSSTISGADISGDITGKASNVTGVVAISNGGTGATSSSAALKALLPDQTTSDGLYLMSKGPSQDPVWEAPVSTPFIEEITATSGQTVVNTTVITKAKANNVAFIQVFLNGVLQREGSNKSYTVTGNKQITFNSGLLADDDITIYSFVKG
jgi:hypothetical protein